MSTADKVLTALGAYKLKSHGQNKYRCNSPLRSGSDSHAFSLTIDGPEHGAWKDFPSGETGTLYDLAGKLGIDLPERAPVQSTKRKYNGLDDYAKAHGAPVEAFQKAGWRDGTHNNRPCLIYPTENGDRYRFLDAQGSTYINNPGYKSCWYGMKHAPNLAKMQDMPLIICNGEASTVTAQYHGLPAIATTAGEGRLPDNLLAELQARWAGDIWIALDCDEPGRKAATAIHEQLPDALVIDLGLDTGGDLADFCMLHGGQAKSQLFKLAGEAQEDLITSTASDTAMLDVLRVIANEIPPKGKPVPFPFPSFHEHRGLFKVMMPGKVIGVMAPSGTGKTSFLETGADVLNKAGENIVWVGPEWTDREYMERRIQRYGGPDLTRLNEHKVWLFEDSQKVPLEQRNGQPLSETEIQRMLKIGNGIRRWPGKTYYFDVKRGESIEQTLDRMQDEITLRRKKGETISVAIFDYVQLMRVADGDKDVNRYEMALEYIKAWTQDNYIVTWIASQVTKVESAAIKQGKTPDGSGALYIREDKVNGLLTLAHEYEELLGEGVPRATGWGKAVINKSSIGSRAAVMLKPQLDKLTWVDPIWMDRTETSG